MIEKKELDIAKEADDVMLALIHVIKELKAGQDVMSVASSSLPKLIDAVSGVDQLDDEWKENRAALIGTAAYRLGELVDSLIG